MYTHGWNCLEIAYAFSVMRAWRVWRQAMICHGERSLQVLALPDTILIRLRAKLYRAHQSLRPLIWQSRIFWLLRVALEISNDPLCKRVALPDTCWYGCKQTPDLLLLSPAAVTTPDITIQDFQTGMGSHGNQHRSSVQAAYKQWVRVTLPDSVQIWLRATTWSPLISPSAVATPDIPI